MSGLIVKAIKRRQFFLSGMNTVFYGNNQGITIMIHVTLKFLGPFRSLVAGADTDGEKSFVFEPGALLSEALLSVPLPDDVPRVVLLNGVQHGDDPPLDDGDVVTIFPPIAGGCPEISMQELSTGTGVYTVSASLQQFGPDMLISVWGGTRPHIGALSISTPHPDCASEESRSSNVLQFSFPGHRDDVVARRVSERVASALQRRIVVSVGIHVPDITPAGIDTVLANVDCLIEKIISLLPDRAPKA